MPLFHVIAFILRFAQLVSSTIVLGIAAHFLNQHDRYSTGPLARLVYTTTVSSISVVLSFVWVIFSTTSSTSSIVTFITDLLASAAWFAAFGVLQTWYDATLLCSGAAGELWDWNVGGVVWWRGMCEQWSAVQAFSFLAAMFWGASFVLGIFVSCCGEQAAEATEGEERLQPWFSCLRV
ncbi:hypothetical protein BKA66DRAFT_570853 [Pyrenochaeta sp. MPI-SDFR-AT-0127]|nr:hypothetical protein BKA66DRAFT_570853 [Pyrenochaeta sp. MPI-SDFR-AT-0127]